MLDRVAQARICDAVRGRTTAIFYSEGPELLTHLSRGNACAVLLAPRDQYGRSTVPVIEEMRSGYPSLPVVAYVVPGRTPSTEILSIAQLGVHELVMQGIDDVGIALRAALESASRRCAATRVLNAIGGLLPREVLPFVRYCLERGAHEPSVTDAARYLGVHRKTLVYRLRQAALPPPSIIIGWCRLFLAAQLLEDPRRSVAQVALELDFASTAALRGMLRRYASLRPQELRAAGGLDALLSIFTTQIRRSLP